MTKLDESRVKERYGRIPKADAQVAGYLKALKIIIAADGSIAPAEAAAFAKGMARLGVDDATRKDVDAFNPKGGKLEDVVPGIKRGGLRARMLVRDAVELSRADGTYAAEEKAAVARAAQLVGVEAATVGAIEALVELEHAAKHLRKSLFPKKKAAS
jgi:tellurite resistance protein